MQLRFIFAISFLLFVVIGSFLNSAIGMAAAQPVAPVNKEMCSSGKVEGSYLVPWTDNRQVRINLICSGPENLIATMRGQGDLDLFYTLLFTAIDGEYYSLTTFGTGRNDAGYIGTNSMAFILKLKLADLKEGRLSGTVRASNAWKRSPVQSTRSVAFAPLPVANPEAKFHLREGSYVPLDKQTSVRLVDIEIVGGIQRIMAKFDIGNSLKMLNGADADSLTDGFYATSSYSRGETGASAGCHIRGRMISENEIEYYYINMEKGLLGPFIARWISD